MCLHNLTRILAAIAMLFVNHLFGEWEESCCHSSLQFGGSYTHANIKIHDQSSFHGNLGGIQAIYEYKCCNGIYAGLRAAWKEGKTENSSADRKLNYVDAEERIGYTYCSCCEDFQVTLFTGLGYRFLKHKLKQHGSPSVEFEYNEFYIPLGFLSEYFIFRCWSLGLNLTWMPQVYPTVEIKPLKGARWILKNTLGNFLVELPLTYYFSENCYSIILKPFYERWGDGRSTAKTSTGQKLGLPKNQYNFWGVELNIGYSF